MKFRGSSVESWAFPALAGMACFAVGWLLPTPAPLSGAVPQAAPAKTGTRPASLGGTKGSGLLVEWTGRVDSTADAALEALATDLLQDPHRRDLAFWGPLLARWSVADAPAMIGFLEQKASPEIRQELLKIAWFAWGASDPDAAFAAGQKLKPAMVGSLLEGVAETDPRKAAGFVIQVPGSQFAAFTIAARIAKAAPDLAEGLLGRAVYDGARYPFEKARISELAATDPSAAMDYARGIGVGGQDPSPGAVEAIARLDPVRAAAEVQAMPSSRSKALSSVSLARTWAARDPAAAAMWIRENLAGPTRHYAFVAAASVSGHQDPAKAFDLLLETDQVAGGDFYRIPDAESVTPAEYASAPNFKSVATDLLRQMSRADAESASRYLREKVPPELQAELALAAGIQP